MAWSEANAQALWPWLLPLTAGHITQYFGQNGENGIDLQMQTGTPITALTQGTVVGNGYYGGGGVVSVESQVPGLGVASVYYQHLDLNAPGMAVGSVVHVGDVVGWSGGQLSGGHHPATCCSSGPHIEVGLNGPWGVNSIWHPLGPNVDPLPWLQSLVANGPSAGEIIASNTSSGIPEVGAATDAVVQTLAFTVRGSTTPVADSFIALEQAMNNALALYHWGDNRPGTNNGTFGDTPGVFGTGYIPDLIDLLQLNFEAYVLRGIYLAAGILLLAMLLFRLLEPVARRVGPAAVQVAALSS